MRPGTLDEVVGHASLLGPDGFLRLFEELSATSAGLPDVRAVMARARDRLVSGGRTVLFIDEIHRFTKSQQDALLPAVEEGLVTLIGATTENPYYEVNAALVSRMRVLVLESLTDQEIADLIARAVDDPRGLGASVPVTDEAREAMVARSGGDARFALNLLEAAAGLAGDGPVTAAIVERAGGRAVVYDKGGDQHYNVISAFIKSMRGSDPDAALYWLAVMLQGGEDPKFIARRIIVLASEDIGNADPRAIEVAVAVARAVEFVGMPEARINLAQAVTYMALAPKGNASYQGINAAMALVEAKIYDVRAVYYNPPNYPFTTNVVTITNQNEIDLNEAGTTFLVPGTLLTKIEPQGTLGHLVTVTATFQTPRLPMTV
ncbi:MAG: replication-associated recombination protein A, partial [Mycobacteriaceae bacterium]|nr:replication-associated recombination protein A [Mycobacteriaceae bacterium]